MTRESDPTSLERSVLLPPTPRQRRIEVDFKHSESELSRVLERSRRRAECVVDHGDDMGYGHIDGVRRPANTPTFDRLAARG